MREALRNRHIGHLIRAYRRYAQHDGQPLSQERVAEWLDLTQPQLSRIERGPAVKDLDKLIRWARTLGVPEDLLWFEVSDRGVEAPGQTTWPSRELPGSIWAATPDSARLDAERLWVHDLHEGTAAEDSAAASMVALRWLLSPPDRPVIRAEGWPRIGRGDVERLRAVRSQLKNLDNTFGGGAAFPMAAGYLRQEVAPLLAGRCDDTIGRGMLGATAELELDVGWMAYDAGDHQLARRYMMQALRMTHAAGDRLLGGRILAAMSHQALHLNQVALGLDLARAARSGAERVATPRAVAMLAAMEACAHAAAQDESLCSSALLTAERALARAGPGDDDPPWLDFDEGGLWGHAARAFRDLGRSRQAKRYAQHSVELCRTSHIRTRAQRNAILATAHLQLGNVDQATAVGLRIIGEAGNVRSRHIQEELASLVKGIQSTEATEAAEFLEQARELLPGRSRQGLHRRRGYPVATT
jgi:transcriptional regulator with XRE-family HTH domain/tetratricopeptide (TPR) repeat protein